MAWISGIAAEWMMVAALVLQLLAAEAGNRLGARSAGAADANLRGQASAIQATLLGLLGLLLAFSFTMAVGRYETRRDLVVEEANAIGTTWLRAAALPPPRDAEVRALLRRYVDARLAFYAAGNDAAALDAAVKETEALQDRLWAIVLPAANEAPGSLPRSLLVEALNGVIDLHSARLAAYDAHVPPTITLLLVAVAAAGLGSVGFAFGLFRGPHRVPTLLLALLVSGILFVILDLDQPRRGLIRVSQDTMWRLQATFVEP
jgi:hypothetical protein